ncbi:MAG: twin-arginine translocase subunit TatC [Phycisphaerae bacterium]
MQNYGNDDEARMTIGEHLEELRWCLVRSLIALVGGCVLCIWPAKYVLALLARPATLVLQRHHQPVNFLQTSPVEVILIYIKVVVIAGLLLASPYVLHQLWSFVGKGLYPHERRYVTRLIPWSVGLFFCGVAFMYTFVLLISLNFLVSFSDWVPLPKVEATAMERLMLGGRDAPTPTTQPDVALPPVPLVSVDPSKPATGEVWFNVPEYKLKVRGVDRVYAVQMVADEQRSLVTTHFKIGDYLSFVLVMTIAFGLAFQMPLVVLFLVGAGIVPLDVLRKYRKLVILIIVIIAGVLAPPDLLSHLMLSGPMIVLFELGLLLAKRSAARRAAADAA